MSFTTEIKIRFSHEDHARVVYYPKYFDFFHQTFEDFFDASGEPYRSVIHDQGVGWPTVQAESRFLKPLSFGDTLRLTLLREKVGNTSATFAYRGVRVSDKALCVEGRTTVVCVSMNDFSPIAVPEKFRALFGTLEQAIP